jgi:hypothetical protein
MKVDVNINYFIFDPNWRRKLSEFKKAKELLGVDITIYGLILFTVTDIWSDQ